MAVVLIFVLLAVPGFPQKKRDWIDGKIIEITHKQTTEFSPVAVGKDPMGGTTMTHITWTFVVESGGMRYTAEKGGDDFPYREGSGLKFVVEKKDLIFLDPKNKELKAKITKAVLKPQD